MPPNAEEPEPETGGRKDRSRPRYPSGGPSADQIRRLGAKLLAMRARLKRSSDDLASEALKGSGQDFSVDHMADYGSDNFEQDFSLGLLEGEAALLQAIDTALVRIAGKDDLPYGLCAACAVDESTWDAETGRPWIPDGRLSVLPYATLCVQHQEEQEEG